MFNITPKTNAMKILKAILFTLAGLVALALISALFINKSYVVERETTINVPNGEVFQYIKYLKNQDNYSVWATMDPNMKKEFRGTDGTVGFVSAWESDNKEVGKGEQEIVGITENQRIDCMLRFEEPFESSDLSYLTTKSLEDGSTQVVWGFNGKMNYPMNLMLVIMDMDKMLGDDLEKGLANLKQVLENKEI